MCEASIRKTRALGFAQKLGRKGFESEGRDFLPHVCDFLHLIQKPWIDVGQLHKFGKWEPIRNGMEKIGDSIRRRRDQLLAKVIFIDDFGARILSGFQRTKGFEESLLKRSP